MNNPAASARQKGPCGDDIEFYISIADGKITDINYYTEKGCQSTRDCGNMVSHLALGKSIEDALSISAGKILRILKALHDPNKHCSILAVSTFYKAIAYYILQA